MLPSPSMMRNFDLGLGLFPHPARPPHTRTLAQWVWANNFADDDTMWSSPLLGMYEYESRAKWHFCRCGVALWRVMPYAFRLENRNSCRTLFALCDAMIILFNEFLCLRNFLSVFCSTAFLCSGGAVQRRCLSLEILCVIYLQWVLLRVFDGCEWSTFRVQ